MPLVKSKEDVRRIKKACKITLGIINYTKKQLRCGMKENDAEKIILNRMKELGVKPAFRPIVAFGSGATTLHHKANNTKIRGKGFLLLDIGCRYRGYCSDISRVFYFNYPMLAAHKHALETVVNTYEIILEMIKPGVRVCDLQKAYNDCLKGKGYRVVHAFGHTLGRQPHDSPRLRKRTVLKTNMVITVEPGVYVRRGRHRFGVRIENDILITKHGCRVLS